MNINGVQIDPWTSLRAGQLPCAACGVAVAREAVSGEDIELLQVASTGRSLSQLNLAVTRCQTCSMIRASALALVGGHPAVRARIGSPEIALHRLESALNALDVLGISDAPTVDRLTSTRSDIMRLMDALTIPGGAARWAVMARSQTFTRVASTRASSARWEHVDPEHRQVLRNAAAGLLARRVEQPVDVLCPSEDGRPAGCLLCGVGAVTALPEHVNEVWTLMSADSTTIGGRPLADTLDGVVCPTCDAAIDAAQGVGQSAMTLAVRAFLGVPRHIRSYEVIPGLIGWAALPLGTAPNTQPWEHIDLSEVREHVSALLAGMTPGPRRREGVRSIRALASVTSPQMVEVL